MLAWGYLWRRDGEGAGATHGGPRQTCTAWQSPNRWLRATLRTCGKQAKKSIIWIPILSESDKIEFKLYSLRFIAIVIVVMVDSSVPEPHDFQSRRCCLGAIFRGKARGKQGESKGKQRILRESKVFAFQKTLYSFVLRGKAIRPSRSFIILKGENEDLGYTPSVLCRAPDATRRTTVMDCTSRVFCGLLEFYSAVVCNSGTL